MNDMSALFSGKPDAGRSPSAAEPVAIIAIRGRFPGAPDVDRLWRNLRDGVESISFFGKEELAAAGVDPAALGYPGFVAAGAVLDDVDMFDAQFFGFNARDAEVMDPQQRLFLECAWEAMEAAGYDAERYPGAVGIYAGCDMSTYMYNIWSAADQLGFVDGMQLAVGNDKDHLTTHASYKLNLRGPSVCVQTACSTSLVAVAMAVESLLARNCDLALAGGVAVNVPQRKGYVHQVGGIVSSDGHCRAFDAAATGTVIGSGIGLVVLKRLSDALADRDHIHAVLKGAALNNDGSAKVGYHAPSIEGQAECIRMALRMAGVTPDTITYVEAHGTGTALGDPIEVAALTHAFRQQTNKRRYCALGTIKSNLGHLASAAGVAGLIKAVLSVEHGEIPPSLHYSQPNPQIDFDSTPFSVNAELKPWTTEPGVPRRAGVSSFGIGGTNAHVIVEEAPAAAPGGVSRPVQPLVLSARTPQALDRATDNLSAWLREHPDADLADVAYVLATGRKTFAHRRALVVPADDMGEAIRRLDERGAGTLTAKPERRDPPVAFLFPGQGTQYAGMARGLYMGEPSFRAVVDHCAATLNPVLNLDLRRIIFPRAGEEKTAEKKLRRTALTQPALFTVEYALAALWMEWGLKPAAMIGHSIGEWVAAAVAGVFTLEEALLLVAERGRLMDSMPTGGMLSVPLSEEELRPWLDGDVSVAALNAPAMSAVSGPAQAIEELSKRLSEKGILTRTLHTSHAFHSFMMEPIVPGFVARVRQFRPRPPALPFVSNVTGDWITAEQATDPDYWGRQLRRPVRFADGVRAIERGENHLWVECGPGQTAATLARQTLRDQDTTLVNSLPGSREAGSDAAQMMTAAIRLWAAGGGVDWRAVYAHEERRRLPLPTYPFERQSYWIGPSERPLAELAESAGVAGPREVADWFHQPEWAPKTPTPLPKTLAADRWLLLSDGGFGDVLAKRLADAGQKVVRARPGPAFERKGADEFVLRPAEGEDYDKLLAALQADGAPPRRIAHLWLAASRDPDATDPAALAEVEALGFKSVLRLSQTIARAGLSDTIELSVLGSQLADPIGDGAVSPAKSSVLGLVRAIPQEMSSVVCRAIDVPAQAADGDAALVDLALAEMTVEPFEPFVALRRARRWVQTYEPVRLPPADAPGRFRTRGTYLITGGLGNIGLTLAQALAERFQARVVLTGRSPVPPRAEWERLAADPGQGALGARVRKLLAIEAAGGEVLALQADASDLAQMEAVLAEARAKFGAVNGVIHGAGNVSSDFTSLADATDAVVDSHFKPKADGCRVLAELLEGERLDFLAVLSSLSAVLAGLTLGVYGSANQFLDAFAARRSQIGPTPWIAIDWDAWLFDTAAGARGLEAILPEDGAEAFFRIVERAPERIVVSVTPLKPRLDKWVYLKEVRAAARSDAGKTTLHARPSLTTQLVAPRSETEKTIANMWEMMIGVAPIGVHDRFFELGGHSLLAIQVTARLKERYGVDVPVQKLFEAPTVAEIAQWLDERVASAGAEEDQAMKAILAQVESLSDEEVARLLEQQEG